jgi:uncharacterized SAM-binding protein YcdF (DUF218 family)
MSRQRLLLGALGACCAALAWLAVGALTGLGKVGSMLFPLSLGIAVVGALLALTRLAILVWLGTAFALLVFLLVTLTPFVTSVLPTKTLVRSDKVSSQPLDAVIVLSGGITPDSLLQPEALDRLLVGLELMRDSLAPLLVVTEPRDDDGVTTAQDQRRIRALVSRSFPMFMIDSVRTTHDEAVNSWRSLSQRDVRRVAVVTSPLHTSRACATFEHVGFVVTCISAPTRAYSIDRARTGQERLEVFRAWLYDWAATVEYRHRGWIGGRSTR